MATDLATAIALGQLGQAGQSERTRRSLAERLTAGATTGRPVYSLGAALAQGLTGALGGYMAADADQREQTARNNAIAEALRGQDERQRAQMDAVIGVTRGNPVPEGQMGPSRPASTGPAREDALALLSATNPAARAQLDLDRDRAQRAAQERLVAGQRATQLEVARIQAGTRNQPQLPAGFRMRPDGTAERIPGLPEPAPDEFQRLLGAAGIEPGSPQAQELARNILERRGQPPQTNVINPPQEGALLRADAQTLQQVSEGTNQARGLLAMFERAREAVRAVPEGMGAQLLPIIGQTARALGYDLPGTSEAEVLTSLRNQMAALQRLPGSGATSDRDMALFLQAVPRLGNTREGNLALIDMGERLMRRRIDEARVWRENIGRPDLMDRLDALGSVFSPEERQMLQQTLSSPASPPPPGPGVAGAEPPLPTFSSPADVNRAVQQGRLRPGDRFLTPDGEILQVPRR
jgi:hypothetical protein